MIKFIRKEQYANMNDAELLELLHKCETEISDKEQAMIKMNDELNKCHGQNDETSISKSTEIKNKISDLEADIKSLNKTIDEIRVIMKAQSINDKEKENKMEDKGNIRKELNSIKEELIDELNGKDKIIQELSAKEHDLKVDYQKAEANIEIAKKRNDDEYSNVVIELNNEEQALKNKLNQMLEVLKSHQEMLESTKGQHQNTLAKRNEEHQLLLKKLADDFNSYQEHLNEELQKEELRLSSGINNAQDNFKALLLEKKNELEKNQQLLIRTQNEMTAKIKDIEMQINIKKNAEKSKLEAELESVNDEITKLEKQLDEQEVDHQNDLEEILAKQKETLALLKEKDKELAAYHQQELLKFNEQKLILLKNEDTKIATIKNRINNLTNEIDKIQNAYELMMAEYQSKLSETKAIFDSRKEDLHNNLSLIEAQLDKTAVLLAEDQKNYQDQLNKLNEANALEIKRQKAALEEANIKQNEKINALNEEYLKNRSVLEEKFNSAFESAEAEKAQQLQAIKETKEKFAEELIKLRDDSEAEIKNIKQEYQAKLTSLASELEKMKNADLDRRNEREVIIKEINDKHREEIEQFKNSLQVANGEYKNTIEKLKEELKEEIAKLHEQKQTLIEELQTKETDRTKAFKELENLKAELSSKQQTKNNEYKVAIEDLQNRIAEKENDLALKLAELKNAKENFNDSIEELNGRLNQLLETNRVLRVQKAQELDEAIKNYQDGCKLKLDELYRGYAENEAKLINEVKILKEQLITTLSNCENSVFEAKNKQHSFKERLIADYNNKIKYLEELKKRKEEQILSEQETFDKAVEVLTKKHEHFVEALKEKIYVLIHENEEKTIIFQKEAAQRIQNYKQQISALEVEINNRQQLIDEISAKHNEYYQQMISDIKTENDELFDKKNFELTENLKIIENKIDEILGEKDRFEQAKNEQLEAINSEIKVAYDEVENIKQQSLEREQAAYQEINEQYKLDIEQLKDKYTNEFDKLSKEKEDLIARENEYREKAKNDLLALKNELNEHKNNLAKELEVYKDQHYGEIEELEQQANLRKIERNKAFAALLKNNEEIEKQLLKDYQTKKEQLLSDKEALVSRVTKEISELSNQKHQLSETYRIKVENLKQAELAAEARKEEYLKQIDSLRQMHDKRMHDKEVEIFTLIEKRKNELASLSANFEIIKTNYEQQLNNRHIALNKKKDENKQLFEEKQRFITALKQRLSEEYNHRLEEKAREIANTIVEKQKELSEFKKHVEITKQAIDNNFNKSKQKFGKMRELLDNDFEQQITRLELQKQELLNEMNNSQEAYKQKVLMLETHFEKRFEEFEYRNKQELNKIQTESDNIKSQKQIEINSITKDLEVLRSKIYEQEVLIERKQNEHIEYFEHELKAINQKQAQEFVDKEEELKKLIVEYHRVIDGKRFDILNLNQQFKFEGGKLSAAMEKALKEEIEIVRNFEKDKLEVIEGLDVDYLNKDRNLDNDLKEKALKIIELKNQEGKYLNNYQIHKQEELEKLKKQYEFEIKERQAELEKLKQEHIKSIADLKKDIDKQKQQQQATLNQKLQAYSKKEEELKLLLAEKVKEYKLDKAQQENALKNAKQQLENAKELSHKKIRELEVRYSLVSDEAKERKVRYMNQAKALIKHHQDRMNKLKLLIENQENRVKKMVEAKMSVDSVVDNKKNELANKHGQLIKQMNKDFYSENEDYRHQLGLTNSELKKTLDNETKNYQSQFSNFDSNIADLQRKIDTIVNEDNNFKNHHQKELKKLQDEQNDFIKDHVEREKQYLNKINDIVNNSKDDELRLSKAINSFDEQYERAVQKAKSYVESLNRKK